MSLSASGFELLSCIYLIYSAEFAVIIRVRLFCCVELGRSWTVLWSGLSYSFKFEYSYNMPLQLFNSITY